MIGSKGILLFMRALPLLLLCAGLLPAQDAKESKSPETVRYRDLAEIVQDIQKDVEAADKASVVWLIDNVPALKTSGAGDLLLAAIPRLFRKPRIVHSILAMGEPPVVVQKPT